MGPDLGKRSLGVFGWPGSLLRVHVLVSALGLIPGCCLVYNEAERRDV